MSKFDLEKALAGAPVVLRDGSKAYVRHCEDNLDVPEPLVGFDVESGKLLSWTKKGRYFNNDAEAYCDIVGMWTGPPVFAHWDLLEESIRYLVMDIDGDWCGYSTKPSLREYGWHYGDGKIRLHNVLSLSAFPKCNWRSSLIKRPENE